MNKGYLISIFLIISIFSAFFLLFPVKSETKFVKYRVLESYLLKIPKADLIAEQQFCRQFYDAFTGKWDEETCEKNVITNAGLNHVEYLMGVGANSSVRYLAIGNGTTPTISSTSLANEITGCGLDRVLGAYYDLGNGWWEINTTYTYSCSGALKANTTGNLNASSGGTFYAGGTMADVNFATSGDQLKLRHNFTFSEAP